MHTNRRGIVNGETVNNVILSFKTISGILYRMVHTWCLDKKGPLFVAMFIPLGIVIAMIMSVMILGDTLHIGR